MLFKPREKPATNFVPKMSPGVAKEGPVPATPDGKGNNPNVSESAPSTLTDPMSGPLLILRPPL